MLICVTLSAVTSILFITECYGQNVTTLLGTFQGTTITTPNGLRVQAFLSVPYAQTPPTSRFSRTQPLTTFTGTFDSTNYRPDCAHWGSDSKTLDPESGEDCLYLKILTPVNPTCCLPVMVWFMGGGFNDGGFRAYDNGALGDNFVSKGVIMVQVNFRQGPFGFFTTGTADAPGNYGLWDALEALKFIRNNIRFFGGNPTRVTIMGQESGAATAELLHLSPLANGYYSSAIYISGSAFDPSITKNDALNIARSQRLAITVGCDNGTEQGLWNTGRRAQVLTCLRGLSTATITSAIGRSDIVDSSTNLFNYYWRPRTDGVNGILPDSFDNLALRRLNVPIMAGIMRDDWLAELVLFPSLNADGSITINSSYNTPEFVRRTCDDQITFNPDIYGSANINRYRQACKNFYVESILAGTYGQIYQTNANFWLQQAGRVATALHNIAPLIKSTTYMRRTGNQGVYLYSWDYDRRDQGTFWVPLGAVRYLENALLESFFIVPQFTFTANDNTVRSVFGDLATNFARFFNPTPANYTRTPQWLCAGNDNRYLSFNVNSTMRTSFYQGDALFWLNCGAVKK